MRMREEKLEEQRLHQEERLRKALERAQADPKKRVSIAGHTHHHLCVRLLHCTHFRTRSCSKLHL